MTIRIVNVSAYADEEDEGETRIFGSGEPTLKDSVRGLGRMMLV